MRLLVVRGPTAVGPFELQEGPNHAGRAPECEIRLPSKRVSRQHALFNVSDGRVVVKDLESHNGIIDADGRRVAVIPLQPGERVQVGDYLLMLEAPLAPTEDELDLDESEEVSLEPEDTQETSIPAAERPAPPPAPPRASTAPLPPPPPKRPPPPPVSTIPPRTPVLEPLLYAPSRAPFKSPFAPGGVPTPPPQPSVPLPPIHVAPPARRTPMAVPEPVRTTGAGLPWWLEATALAAFTLSVVLCAPVGGLFDQLRAGGNAVEAADADRGVALTELLAARNAGALHAQSTGTIDAGLVDRRAGVRGAVITDARGTVLAPADKRRQSVASHPAWQAAARDGGPGQAPTDDGLVEIVAPARVSGGEVVGYAVVEFDAAAAAAGRYDAVARGLVALVLAGVALVGLGLGVNRLALRPMARLREETERALDDDAREVHPPARVAQAEDLAHVINRVLAKARGR